MASAVSSTGYLAAGAGSSSGSFSSYNKIINETNIKETGTFYQTAKIELEVVESFQKRLHEMIEGDFYTDFFEELKPISRGVPIRCTVPSLLIDKKMTFQLDTKFTYLSEICMVQFIPSLTVEPKMRKRVEIRWTPYVHTNAIKHASLEIDNRSIQTLNRRKFNVWYHLYGENITNYRENYNICVGNTSELTTWNTHLPELPSPLVHPWYYSQNLARSLPLFFCSLSRISHIYDIRFNIYKLLQVRYWTEDIIIGPGGKKIYSGNPMPYDIHSEEKSQGKKNSNKKITLEDILGIKDIENFTIRDPILYARYILSTDEEINQIQYKYIDVERHELGFEETQDLYAEELIEFKADMKSNIEIDCKNPAKAIILLAENRKAKKMNYYSNYTTNADDRFLGKNPFESFSLFQGSLYKYKNLPSYITELIEPRQGRTYPSERGYNMISIGSKTGYSVFSNTSVYSGTHSLTVSFVLSKSDQFPTDEELFSEIPKVGDNSLNVPIFQQDPFSSLSNDNKLQKSKKTKKIYMIYAYLLVIRQIICVYDRDKKGWKVDKVY